MREFTKGMYARSKAGHDTGKLYVIMQTDDKFVYLTDGKIRTLEHLKKKKRKHIQIICQVSEQLKEIMESGQEVRDEHIKKAIKDYEKSQQEV